MRKIIVIGGGAAGLASAIAAAREGASVTVLEFLSKPGWKIALSGNGRCNLSNRAHPEDMYHGSDPAFAAALLKENTDELIDYFAFCGIATRLIGSGYYPMSEEAVSVQKNMLLAAESLKIVIRNQTRAVRLEKREEGFLVHTENWTYEADRVILAAGSKAHVLDEAIGGYALAEQMGHTVVKPLPALVALELKGDLFQKWAGARARGTVTLSDGDTPVLRSSGQIQCTRYGVSGIAVMDVSGTAARLLEDGHEVFLTLDLLPEVTEGEAADLFRNDRSGGLGILPAKILAAVRETAAGGPSPEEYARISKHFRFEVLRTRPMSEAQCASGGIPVQEIHTETMASRKTEGLYLCGEILDVDGICGGYNLSFAFLSGLRAGRSAAHD